MKNSSFEVGVCLQMDGKRYRVTEKRKGSYLLEHLKDDRLTVKSGRDLESAYTKGTLQFDDLLGVPSEKSTALPGELRSIADVSNRARHEATIKLSFLQVICPQGHVLCQRADLRDKLVEVNNGLPADLRLARPPSISSFCQWRNTWIASGYSTRSLCPRFDMRGRRSTPVPQQLLEIIEPVVQETYLSLKRVTLNETVDQVNGSIKLYNRNQPTADQLPLATRLMVRKVITNLDRALVLERRYGKRIAAEKCRMNGKNKRVERLLERVEVDHTPLDVIALTGEGGVAGRPWLTTIIDVGSRMVLGLHISFRAPSTSSVLRALRIAILPKSQLLKDLGIRTDYEAYGVPVGMFLDNGAEFHSNDLEHAAQDLDISLYYCPRKEPRFKGVVERWLKTINYNFIQLLPGATFARYQQRGELDSLKDAVIPLEDLNRMIWKWVAEVYSRTKHSGLLTCPREMWTKLQAKGLPVIPRNAKLVDFYTSPIAQRKLSSKGIEINCQFYKSDELERIRTVHGDIELTVRPDMDNLGSIVVLDPETRRYFKAFSTDPELAEGVSLEEDETIRRVAAAQYEALDHRSAYLIAKAEIRQEVKAMMTARDLQKKGPECHRKQPRRTRPSRGELHAITLETQRQEEAEPQPAGELALRPLQERSRRIDFSKIKAHPIGQGKLF